MSGLPKHIQKLVSNINKLHRELKSTRNETRKIRVQGNIVEKGRKLANEYNSFLNNAVARGYNNRGAINNARENIRKLRSNSAQAHMNLRNLLNSTNGLSLQGGTRKVKKNRS